MGLIIFKLFLPVKDYKLEGFVMKNELYITLCDIVSCCEQHTSRGRWHVFSDIEKTARQSATLRFESSCISTRRAWSNILVHACGSK